MAEKKWYELGGNMDSTDYTKDPKSSALVGSFVDDATTMAGNVGSALGSTFDWANKTAGYGVSTVGQTINQGVGFTASGIAGAIDYTTGTNLQEGVDKSNQASNDVYNEYRQDPNKRGVVGSALDSAELLLTGSFAGYKELGASISDYIDGTNTSESAYKYFDERKNAINMGKGYIQEYVEKPIGDYYQDNIQVADMVYKDKLKQIDDNPDEYKDMVSYFSKVYNGDEQLAKERLARDTSRKYMFGGQVASLGDYMFKTYTGVVEVLSDTLSATFPGAVEGASFISGVALNTGINITNYTTGSNYEIPSLSIDSLQNWWQNNIRNTNQVLVDEVGNPIEDHSKIGDYLRNGMLHEKVGGEIRRITSPDEIDIGYGGVVADLYLQGKITNVLEKYISLGPKASIFAKKMDEAINPASKEAFKSFLQKTNFKDPMFSKINIGSSIVADVGSALIPAIAEELNKKGNGSMQSFLDNMLIGTVIGGGMSASMHYLGNAIGPAKIDLDLVKDDMKAYLKNDISEGELYSRLKDKDVRFDTADNYVVNAKVLKNDLAEVTQELMVKQGLRANIEKELMGNLEESFGKTKEEINNNLRPILKEGTGITNIDQIIDLMQNGLLSNCK